MANKDYYSVLGVEKSASEDELKKAYRSLSKKYHPDLQQGKSDAEKKAAEEKFKEINEAYSVLGDKEKREQYDRFGTSNFSEQGFGPGGFDPMAFFRRHFSNFDFDFGMGDGPGYRQVNPDSPRNGRDTKISLEISFEESIYGTTREFDIKFDETCPHCKGTGSEGGELVVCDMCNGSGMHTERIMSNFIRSITCPKCHGEGHTPKNKCTHCNGNKTLPVEHHIHIHIPPGVDSGATLRIPGEGEHGINGGNSGDLYIRLTVRGGVFRRSGDDLATTVYIPSVGVGILDSIEVQTPWGKTSVSIPEKMDGDCTFTARIPGYGIRRTDRAGNSVSGNLYVLIVPEPLQNLTDKQKKLAKKLLESVTEQNTPLKNANSRISRNFAELASKFGH